MKGGVKMEFNIGKNAAIVLPPLPITLIAIVIIFLLVRWSKQLEKRRFTVFFYFLISAYIVQIYSSRTIEKEFELWLPVGFIAILIYLILKRNNHPAKIKASLLGFGVALYQLYLQYLG
jgi:hypothetical protein